MKRRALWFTGPRRVEVRSELLPPLQPGQLLIATRLSAISAGSELLVYRGEAPANLAADSTIGALAGDLAFPLQYGYAAVGVVIEDRAGGDWLGETVFAFEPHASHFVAEPAQLIRCPSTVDAERLALLPNMESSVAIVMDARPLIGERVVVFGQGVVGLLITRLLAQMPLAELVAVDAYQLRRRTALQLGATASVAPGELAGNEYDLAIEVSGNPQALELAIGSVGYGGRVVIGSWYGTKRASLDLGGRFHRNQIELIGSQVSTLRPQWRGRWTKQRRLQSALAQLGSDALARLPVEKAAFAVAESAYRRLDEQPQTCIQLLLTYNDAA